MGITTLDGRARRGWTADDPPARIAAFVDWYVHERAVGDSLKGYADRTGVPYVTVMKWSKDPRVTQVLDTQLKESNAGPIKVQMVLEMLHRRAVDDQDVKAAQVYLQAVDRLVPRRQVDVTIRDARQLSDTDLHAELRRAISLLEDQRGVGPAIEDAEVLEDSLDAEVGMDLP